MVKDGMYCHPEVTAGTLHRHDLTGRCGSCRERTQWHTAEHAPLCLTCGWAQPGHPRRRIVTDRLPGHVFADEIVAGLRIIPPGGKRPVTVLYQLSPTNSGQVFKFACQSAQGYRALRLNRCEQVLVVA